MKCMDCVEKGGIIREAEWIMLGDVTMDYKILALCYGCLHEYIHAFGEIDVESFPINQSTLPQLIKEVNRKYKYLSEMYSRLLGEYSTLKKQVQSSFQKANQNEP